jgi:hypothetical protein
MPAGRPTARIVALVTAIVAVLAGAGTFALTHSRAAAGRPQAAAQGLAPAGAAGRTVPLRVLSVTPATGSRQVNGADPVQVAFSAPLAPGSPRPRLSPAVAGRWQQAGRQLVFTPAVAFAAATTVTVQIPAGAAGVRSAAGGQLARPVVIRFRTGAWKPRRLAELLAQLRYLPVSWRPDAGERKAAIQAPGSWLAGQVALAFSPPAGRFVPERGYPAALRSRWRPGTGNVILRGAVMAFESEHHMAVSGRLTPALWQAVFRAAAAGRDNRNGYTYAIVSQSAPERLTIWHDGHVVLRSPANTGIPQAPTADGTFPVYRRYRFQIMRGINPDGRSYADPVSFVSYFNGGDAVHYFPRGAYGFQQSLGCVELPYTAAEQAWRYLTDGSLVTVSG